MTLFNNSSKKPFSYELSREGDETVMHVSMENYPSAPSIEDDPSQMAKLMDNLMEARQTSKVVFIQRRDYEYDEEQTELLNEIARLINKLGRQKQYFSYKYLLTDQKYSQYVNQWFNELQNRLLRRIKSDPIGVYVEASRIMRREMIEQDREIDEGLIECRKKFISILRYLAHSLEKTKLIEKAKPYLPGMKLNDRTVYRKIFNPSIKPDFMYTKLMASYPMDGEELDNYTIGDDTEVTIFSLPNSVQYLYHIMPPEFKLDEEKYELLDVARKIMSEHKPKKSEFVDPERMRKVFSNVGSDLIEELAQDKGVRLRSKDVESLTKMLVRYTVGFGLIEVLLLDEKIQDISINSPMGQIPIFIVHAEYDDCTTNVVPTPAEAESWATKLRLISGRPLDEANPILDTELQLPGASTRVSAITEPLDPSGLAFSFRRHRDKPWTLPLFIKKGMITPLAAGLISFLVDGTRTMLIAGTRSSGKSSFLSAVMVEIMRRYRIITIEDTLELPTDQMRKLGFNIQAMKVSSALSLNKSEVNASDGIRSTLRLGDSSLIIGEVRSTEAIALYEAMRVGAAANVVAGTIHGDSPYGVFDRVVNDIGVPKTSFKATDIIIVANPIKSPDGIHKLRRVTQITEVRKDWTDDPLAEGGFKDLMKYSAETDQLEPTDGLTNGDSQVLKAIAGNIKEFAGNWDAVMDNIQLRANIKEAIVEGAKRINDDEILEAPFVIECNDKFHRVSESVKEETDQLDSKRIFSEWKEWFERELKKRLDKKNE